MRRILVKTWSALLLVTLIGLIPPAAADDLVVARVNGVDIKQSELDFAASEVGSSLASYTPEDRKKALLQLMIENELMAGAAAKGNLDKADDFADRVKYHYRRALREHPQRRVGRRRKKDLR
jgi:peptidyl-prolyl cis-trans isomerase C